MHGSSGGPRAQAGPGRDDVANDYPIDLQPHVILSLNHFPSVAIGARRNMGKEPNTRLREGRTASRSPDDEKFEYDRACSSSYEYGMGDIR